MIFFLQNRKNVGTKSSEEHTGFLPDLVSGDAELDGDLHRLIGHSDSRLDQRHEEEREPDDADQSEDDEASHPVFYHLLLPLPWGVGVFLEEKQINYRLFT